MFKSYCFIIYKYCKHTIKTIRNLYIKINIIYESYIIIQFPKFILSVILYISNNFTNYIKNIRKSKFILN